MMDHTIFMKEAIRLSQLAVSHGNEPFGAVLVKDGEIVYSNENQIYTGFDPTFHAEAGLLRRFCACHGFAGIHPLFQLRTLLYVLRRNGMD